MLTFSQTSEELEGVPTDVVIQPFADQILVLITQLGKVGNLIQVTMPDTAPLLPSEPSANPSEPSLPPPSPSIQLTPLLGQAQSEQAHVLHSLYASQVATLVWSAGAVGQMDHGRQGVIVGVALKQEAGSVQGVLNDRERRVFLGVMKMVKSLLTRS